MKKNALKDIKDISVKISIETVEKLIQNSVNEKKLESIYAKSLLQTKTSLKKLKFNM